MSIHSSVMLLICYILKDCMRGPLAKTRVLYAPVEEIGDEGRLLRACRILVFSTNVIYSSGMV